MTDPHRASAEGIRGEEAAGERTDPVSLLPYLLLGTFFGIVLIKSEVASWYRIQEMFRFGSFHMYGVLMSAVVTGAVALQLFKRLGLRDRNGQPLVHAPKHWQGIGTRYWLGGIFFGLGWSILGACPGPIFALVGSGFSILLLGLAGALLGTWTYALMRPGLPH